MKEYPITDGIINALPPELNYSEPNVQAKTWWQVHEEVFPQYKTKDLLSDKNAMAQVQKDFYDKMAVGFQAMDDIDKKTGGVMLWRINRVAKYDEQFFKKNKLLFIGAGNCRNAIRLNKRQHTHRLASAVRQRNYFTYLLFSMTHVGRSVDVELNRLIKLRKRRTLGQRNRLHRELRALANLLLRRFVLLAMLGHE